MKKSNGAIIRDLKKELIRLQGQHLKLLDVAKKMRDQLEGKAFMNARRDVGPLIKGGGV